MAERLPAWLETLASSPAPAPQARVLAGGRNNQGVVLHRLLAGGEGTPRLVIEKRSRHRAEARLYRRLLRWQQRHPEAGLLPRVYGVLPDGAQGWRLFQAYVPEAMPAPEDPCQAGRLLADLAFRFHGTMAAVIPGPPPPLPALLQRQRRRLDAAGDAEGLDPPAVTDLVERLALRLAAQRPVLAHNDLHWSNIRLPAGGVPAGQQLIDLGRAGWNLAGAEFHGALRQSLLGGGGPPVWQHAIDHYATLSGDDPLSLRLGCLWFALVHSAGLWRQVRLQEPALPRRREGRLLRRLLSRLRAALDVAPSPPPPAG
ncbi:phosphotransferase family protein [Cyanobium sp. NIES-981]|uniref:phosphotransferase family protein n=1 Tax=Cyanobium sp. NIES-981 TaxID=1851505 RepID=UPI0007DDACDF|nr:phosphotransferase [Cyanobium sp. NIES-981]SBO43909.1 conserved protein of unknown function [Cyanobium sp. NIES-981]